MQSHRWRSRSNEPVTTKEAALVPVPTKTATPTKASGKETERITNVVCGSFSRHP